MKALEHVAFRVRSEDHKKVIDMFTNLFGYVVADEFEPEFDDSGDHQSTICNVLTPIGVTEKTERIIEKDGVIYQTKPDIFISSSTDPNSIVAKFVEKNGPSPHHLAFVVPNSVEETMKKFNDAGIEFLSDDVIACPELSQNFTKIDDSLGIIFECLERRSGNFCKKSVGKLMKITEEK